MVRQLIPNIQPPGRYPFHRGQLPSHSFSILLRLDTTQLKRGKRGEGRRKINWSTIDGRIALNPDARRRFFASGTRVAIDCRDNLATLTPLRPSSFLPRTFLLLPILLYHRINIVNLVRLLPRVFPSSLKF